jgi:hypothetical protein
MAYVERALEKRFKNVRTAEIWLVREIRVNAQSAEFFGLQIADDSMRIARSYARLGATMAA